MGHDIDITRLSQKALPIAKKYDLDKNGSLNSDEYNKFISIWNQENNSESPYLMQLHTKSLTDEAQKIAEECDTNLPKGVLTECELDDFMKKYENSDLKQAFKNGVDVSEAITGERKREMVQNGQFEEKKDNFANKLNVKYNLFKNWLKLDVMNYKGSDKYFHAVGNFEAMQAGSEEHVEKVCAGQDADKRSNKQRSEADYAEDLYANFLGREFAKLYPNETPHELFEPLAPTGFDVNKARNNVVKLAMTSEKNSFKNKSKEYIDYLKEEYIVNRIKSEVRDLL